MPTSLKMIVLRTAYGTRTCFIPPPLFWIPEPTITGPFTWTFPSKYPAKPVALPA